MSIFDISTNNLEQFPSCRKGNPWLMEGDMANTGCGSVVHSTYQPNLCDSR